VQLQLGNAENIVIHVEGVQEFQGEEEKRSQQESGEPIH
jgi:hypothetical protein